MSIAGVFGLHKLTEVSLPGEQQEPVVSITEIQSSCVSLISRWFLLTFLIINATLDHPLVLKLSHVDDDETHFSEFILSKLCWWPPLTL